MSGMLNHGDRGEVEVRFPDGPRMVPATWHRQVVTCISDDPERHGRELVTSAGFEPDDVAGYEIIRDPSGWGAFKHITEAEMLSALAKLVRR